MSVGIGDSKVYVVIGILGAIIIAPCYIVKWAIEWLRTGEIQLESQSHWHHRDE